MSAPVPSDASGFTEREQEILALLAEGYTNQEIADRLFLSLTTIKWYNTQIFAKLGVTNRARAVMRARDLNVLLSRMADLPSASPSGDDATLTNPYKGLRAFQTSDEKDFFGREKYADRLMKRLSETGKYSRFLVVIGPSGSGKSSLLKAGLIPALHRRSGVNSKKWSVAEMMPGTHPLDELEIALAKVESAQVRHLHEHLRRDTYGLVRASSLVTPDDCELLLIVDQFEELFSLVRDEEDRVYFLDLLYTAVTEPHSRVHVVITLRADFYDRPLLYPRFGALVRRRLETILPLAPDDLERAIIQPAERIGVTFEPGLVASIMADVNHQPGALPLLQYALTELFERRQGRLLTSQTYDALGRIGGALAQRVDDFYNSLNEAQQASAKQLFLRLITLGEEAEDVRRRVKQAELAALPDDSRDLDYVIDEFSRHRLLTRDRDPATQEPTVELAHEALIREWGRLQRWLEESRADLRLQRLLANSATEWINSGRDPSFTLTGSRLAQFEEWAASTSVALTTDERIFLEISIAERERQAHVETERHARERQLERRSHNFLRGLVAILLLAVLGAFGLTVLAVNQGQSASRHAAEAQQVALVSGSQAALANGNTDIAIALAMQAALLDATSARAQTALSEAAYAPGTTRRFTGHSDAINRIAVSFGASRMVSASADTTVILWDLQTGDLLRRFEGHNDNVTSVALSPDSHQMLSGSTDSSLILWNTGTGEIIRRFIGHNGAVLGVAISPDGTTAASVGADSVVILWDIATGQSLLTMQGHRRSVNSVEFSSDGRTLLTASDDTTVILWDARTGSIVRRFSGHQGPVYDAALSPNGRMILSGGDDRRPALWNAVTGQVIRRFAEDQYGNVLSVAFSPDGNRAVTGFAGAVVVVSDLRTGLTIERFEGHSGRVNDVSFDADGNHVVSGASDRTIRIWDLNAGQLIREFTGQPGTPLGIAFSPDGRTAIVGSGAGQAVEWEVQTARRLRILPVFDAWDAEFTHDGQGVLLGSGDPLYGTTGNVLLWDLTTGREIRRFGGNDDGHHSGVQGIALSPDGRIVASCAGDGLIILWDTQSGQEIRRLDGHDACDDAVFSPNGQTLLSGGRDGGVILWNVITGQQILRFGANGEGHTRLVNNLIFREDGLSAVSSAWDGRVFVWEVATGTIIRRLEGHSAASFQVSLSPDDRLVFAGSADNTSLLWDVETGEILRRYGGANAGAFRSAFSPDGRSILVDFFDGRVELWRIDNTLDELLAWTRANRYIPDLTCDQRELYRLEPLCLEGTEM